MNKLLCVVVLQFLFSASVLLAQMPLPHSHVDQFIYLPTAEKVAVISDSQVGYNSNLSYTPGPVLEVINKLTGTVVFSAGTRAFWESRS